MDKVGLTMKQQEVYDFLRMYHKVHGVFPTVREISSGQIEGQQVIRARASHTSVQRMLKAIQERGWITVMPMRGRAIKLL